MTNRLTTIKDVVDAIGRERVIRITKRGSSAVSNWHHDGFPPETYVVITEELERLGLSASKELWPRMVLPKGGRAA